MCSAKVTNGLKILAKSLMGLISMDMSIKEHLGAFQPDITYLIPDFMY